MSLTVLQIIPNLGAGGAEQACAAIVSGLVARGDRALVVSSGGALVEAVERAGGIHITHPVATKNPMKILANARWLADLIRKEKVDIIHARSRAPAWSAWVAAGKAPCHFVTTAHAVYKFSNAFKRVYNAVMTRGERVIAISQFVADQMVQAYGVDRARIRVVYRGIDIEKFTRENIEGERREKLQKAWEIAANSRVVILPGRLSRIKNQALLIEAMALLPEDMKNVVAVIIGDDQGRSAYRAELQDLIAARGLNARVRLVPHCDDMPAAYSLADVVAMPSRVPEGFGRVPVEAMAMGVPVIASALGATVETVVEGVTGWLLPPEDPAHWAQALAQALSLPLEARATMADAAIKRAREKFTQPAMIAQTLSVYDELMGT